MLSLKWRIIEPRTIPPLFGLILLAGLLTMSPASAQGGGQVRIAEIDDSTFPMVTTYMDVKTAEGDFVDDLSLQDITVIEDSARLPAGNLELLRPGVQFVLAISPGDAFTIRDSQGISRYEYLAEALASWAEAKEGTSIDDLSFLVSGGPESEHIPGVEQWLAELGSYQPEEGSASPEFDTLSRAIDLAADQTPPPGQGQAVLFITALPTLDAAPGLQNLAARASQTGVRVFVWLVASSEQFASPGAGLLSELASSTGGVLFPFSGQEPIPDLEDYLEPLRSMYRLSFESQITTSGLHQVSVEINRGGLEAVSQVLEFTFEVLPPNIAFISPPAEIVRTAPEESLEDPAAYSPKILPLEILLEFPDGHARPIQQTSLFVDDILIQTNTTEPFDQFNWDLSGYTTTSEHVLVVEAIDSLDMVGRSLETKVLVTMDIPSRSVLSIVSENSSLLAILAVIIAGAVLLLILVMGGRLRPGFVREMRRKRRRADPVTQPVPVRTELPGRQKQTWIDRLPWPQRTAGSKAFAYLVPIAESGDERSTPPLSISRDEEILGQEPDRVTLVLDEASVEAVHARLVRDHGGEFRIIDEGSVAGTWVNYTPISREGVRLEHGDLVHIGRLGFRFVVREPLRVRKPVVKPGEPAS